MISVKRADNGAIVLTVVPGDNAPDEGDLTGAPGLLERIRWPVAGAVVSRPDGSVKLVAPPLVAIAPSASADQLDKVSIFEATMPLIGAGDVAIRDDDRAEWHAYFEQLLDDAREEVVGAVALRNPYTVLTVSWGLDVPSAPATPVADREGDIPEEA